MKASDDSAISIRDLHVRYPGAHALQGLDLSVRRGSFTLIGGPSGSGKSVLAHALLGLLRQEDGAGAPVVSGHVVVGGLNPGIHPRAELATRIGLVFQNPATQLFNGTVGEEVGFGPRNLGLDGGEVEQRVTDALDAVGAEHLRGRSVRRLSGGEQQRVAIAAALAMRPTIMVLDEPTANLDAEGTASVVRSLVRLRQEWGITVVVMEHRLKPFFPHAERLIWLEKGRVVADGHPDCVLPDMEPEPLRGAAPARGAAPGRDGDPLVALEDVTVGYNDGPVLHDCSVTLRRGELAALVGPNGSGKSTLARVVAGLERPWRGRVVWHGGRRKAGGVGFLQQDPIHQLVCATVEEEVGFAPRNLGLGNREWTDELIGRLGLRSLRHRPTQALSVGEQQRTALCATMSMRPELLILDEPTIGQDRHHLRQLMKLVLALNAEGQTVLFITHDRDLVEGCASRIWEVGGGRAWEV